MVDGWAIRPVIVFYGAVVQTGVRSLEHKMFHVKHLQSNFFAFFSDFCILRSNRGVQNTAKIPAFCSTNIDARI